MLGTLIDLLMEIVAEEESLEKGTRWFWSWRDFRRWAFLMFVGIITVVVVAAAGGFLRLSEPSELPGTGIPVGLTFNPPPLTPSDLEDEDEDRLALLLLLLARINNSAAAVKFSFPQPVFPNCVLLLLLLIW